MKTTTSVEITAYNPASVSRHFSFKNPTLNAVSEEIAAIGGRLTAESAKLAVLLVNVDNMGKDKLAEDGFKSVAAYASDTFNIGKAAVSQLTKSARRFYIDADGNTIKPDNAESVARWYSPYTLCYIADFPAETLQKAVEDGELTADMSQADVKAWASGHKETPEKTEIVQTYTVNILSVRADTLAAKRNEYHNVEMDAFAGLDEVSEILGDGDVLTDSPFKSSVDGWKGRLIVGADGYAIIHYMPTPKQKRPKTAEEKEAAERAMLAKLMAKYGNA